MRPIRLQVEGFTSFRSPQEVDFSGLDLFVITGDTGSGKTSILEAVTLALYGKVPRTKNDTHQLKELISLGASQAKVQLDFEVGRRLYRVARRLPKNGAQTATIERVEDGEIVSEVEGSGVREANARIAEIIGLDYDAFTRAVLLPQDAFAEFLKGDASERRDILIRLLDLDRFIRVGKLAGDKARELGHEVTAGEEILAREYEDIQEETIEDAEHRAARAEQEAVAVERANREAKQRWEEREASRRRLQAVEGIEKKLGEHACELAKLRELWSELSEEDSDTSAALKRAREERAGAEEKYRGAKATWTGMTEDVGDESLLAEFAQTAKTLAESEERIKATSAALTKTEEEQRQRHEQREKLAERLEAAQASEQQAKEQAEKSTAAMGSARESLARAMRRASLVEQLEEQRERDASLRRELDHAETAEKSATDRLQEATRRLHALETEHRAVFIRSHLHIGDDCPVCGSEIDQLPETDAATESELEAARAARDDADARLRESGKTASARRSTIEGVGENIRRIEKELEEVADGPALSDAEEALKDAEGREREARNVFEAVGGEVKSALSEMSEHDQALARLETKLSEGRSHLVDTEEKGKRCRTRLAEVLGEPLPDDYAEVIAGRQGRLREATSALKTADDSLGEAREAFERAFSGRVAFERELQDFDGSTRSQRSLLTERREAISRFLEVEVPILPSEDSHEREASLGGLDEYRKALAGLAADATAGCTKEIDEVHCRLSDLLADAQVGHHAGNLATALKVLDERTGKLRVEAERSKDAVTLLRERLARKQSMTHELTEKRSKMRLYDKVAGELRRDRFISFLLDESFQDLALRASTELEQISAGRYSLAAEKDSFAVVDHANADERRSVVTLSGGETFLASLALALALAQGIRDIAGHSAAARLESMFIDEGFGSLDPIALDLAVEALERLREGERMVGVITHVAALAERIPAGIAVEKRGGASVVVLR